MRLASHSSALLNYIQTSRYLNTFRDSINKLEQAGFVDSFVKNETIIETAPCKSEDHSGMLPANAILPCSTKYIGLFPSPPKPQPYSKKK